jgi:hypothetical protein
MYKNLNEVAESTGVCKTQIIRHCYKGDAKFCNIGFNLDNMLVEADDMIELKVKGEI